MADQDKPAAPIINLDSAKRNFNPEPFVFIMDGRRITMKDAQEIDWQELTLALSTSPRALFRLVVPEDDQDAFFRAGLPTWKMRLLTDAYTKHYQIGPEG